MYGLIAYMMKCNEVDCFQQINKKSIYGIFTKLFLSQCNEIDSTAQLHPGKFKT